MPSAKKQVKVTDSDGNNVPAEIITPDPKQVKKVKDMAKAQCSVPYMAKQLEMNEDDFLDAYGETIGDAIEELKMSTIKTLIDKCADGSEKAAMFLAKSLDYNPTGGTPTQGLNKRSAGMIHGAPSARRVAKLVKTEIEITE